MQPTMDRRRLEGVNVALALALSVIFGALFWIWERELLWMLAVTLPPIWSPVIYRHFASEDSRRVSRVAIAGLVAGLAVLAGAGLLTWIVI